MGNKVNKVDMNHLTMLGHDKGYIGAGKMIPRRAALENLIGQLSATLCVDARGSPLFPSFYPRAICGLGPV